MLSQVIHLHYFPHGLSLSIIPVDYSVTHSDYTQHDTDYSYVSGNSEELLRAYKLW